MVAYYTISSRLLAVFMPGLLCGTNGPDQPCPDPQGRGLLCARDHAGRAGTVCGARRARRPTLRDEPAGGRPAFHSVLRR